MFKNTGGCGSRANLRGLCVLFNHSRGWCSGRVMSCSRVFPEIFCAIPRFFQARPFKLENAKPWDDKGSLAMVETPKGGG